MKLAAFTFAVFAVGAQLACAAWRGDGTGIYADATPPTAWSPTSNVLWRTPLPSWSNASPALAPDRLFVGSEPDSLVCVARSDGRILWTARCRGADTLTPEQLALWESTAEQRNERDGIERDLKSLNNRIKKTPEDAELLRQRDELAPRLAALEAELKNVPPVPTLGGHQDNGGTAATTAVDAPGRRVFTFFGNGIVTAHDFDGKRLWIRALELGQSGWGHSSSPILAEGRLIVSHGAVSALDPQSGEPLWSTPSKARHGTPVTATVASVPCIVTPAGLLLRVSDGNVLARNLPELTYNAPIVANDVVYGFGMGDSKAAAYRLPATAGEEPVKLWEVEVAKARYYASPVLYNGMLYGMNQKGVLTVLDAADGRKAQEVKVEGLKGECYPSPTIADSRLFVGAEQGATVVFDPSDLSVIARNGLEKTRATPAFDGGLIYVRGQQHMYCIGTN